MKKNMFHFLVFLAFFQPQNSSAQEQFPWLLVTAAGKAWVIKDNNIQGSGKACIFKADGSFEQYNRVYGIWIPVSTNNTYTADSGSTVQWFGTSITLTPRIKISVGGSGNEIEFEYTISGNGSTLTMEGKDYISGTYTLMDFSGPERPGGGDAVLPTGFGWFRDGRQMIFNTNGIYAAYGFPGPWAAILHEGTYRVNSSTGKITINESVPPQSGRDAEYFYSITDFGGSNKTLRIWGENRNGYQDDVYKLQSYPAGTQLPRTR